MHNSFKQEDSFILYWTENLVGTSLSFTINLMLHLAAGLLYSFKVIPSSLLLLVFGVISPILFTLCLYTFIRSGSVKLFNDQLPSAFVSRSGNWMLMLLDISLITGFALLIYFGPLNYFLFRFLQTIFFPCLLLIFLRVLFLSRVLGKFLDEDDE